jgi:hypothetical protein
MKLLEETLRHPSQASLVRLRMFRQPEGFLLTEEWAGSTTVYKTLGLFEDEAAAAAQASRRLQELTQQRFERVPEA